MIVEAKFRQNRVGDWKINFQKVEQKDLRDGKQERKYKKTGESIQDVQYPTLRSSRQRREKNEEGEVIELQEEILELKELLHEESLSSTQQ